MSLDRFAPSRPVPVMHVHSVDDPRALYDGGLGPAFPGTSHRVEHAPVEAGLGPWIAHNGCAREAQIAETRRGRSDTASAGHTASRLVYRPCSSGADVVLWKLTGAGHGWPGGRSGTPERLIGPHTTVIDAAEEIWAFVSRFTR
jgi:polyhydroxybutyrate depolymerase